MAYKQINITNLQQWIAENPGKTYRINGQTFKAPEKTRSGLGNILWSLSKPFRAIPGSVAEAISADRGGYDNPFLSEEEEMAFRDNPYSFGAKSVAGLGSYLVPGGSTAGTAGKRIFGAAGKGAIAGGLGGYGASREGEELESTLRGAGFGGLLGGGLQAVGEGAKALQGVSKRSPIKAGKMEIDDIAKLPDKTRKNLLRQAKSAGFDDRGLSDSKNIQNFLSNRGLAGDTPAETLELMTQEFNRAQKLKGDGLKEIGGLSKGYVENIKNNIEEAIQYSGLSVSEKTALESMKKVLDSVPTDAKTLDKIAQDWYKMGLTRAGEQKMTQSGLYMDGAKAIRDALKEANKGGSYTEGMDILSRILGLEDAGTVSKAAKEAASKGIDIPLFAGSGFRGGDIKTGAVTDAISRARAQAGRMGEVGVGGLSPQMSGLIGGATRIGQRAVPAITAMPEQAVQQVQQQQMPQMPQQTGPQLDEMKVMQAVLSGQLSTTEANMLMDMFGSQATETKQTETQRDYQMAADALTQAYNTLQTIGGAGKLATAYGNIAGFLGATTPSSEYRSQLDTAIAFLRKALIGSGQSEAELKSLNLPKPTDEPAVAAQKIEALIPHLRDRAGGQIQQSSGLEALNSMLGL